VYNKAIQIIERIMALSQELESEIRKNGEKVADLEKELDGIQSKIKEHNEEIQRAESKVRDLKRDLKVDESKERDVMTEIGKLRSGIGSAEQRLAQAKQEESDKK